MSKKWHYARNDKKEFSQVKDWVENQYPKYVKELKNVSDNNIIKLVRFIASAVRTNFQKLDEKQRNDEQLIEEVNKYLQPEKPNISWHFEHNDNDDKFYLTLGPIPKKALWIEYDYVWVTNNFDNSYSFDSPIRFYWWTGIPELSLQVINEQSSCFYSNKPIEDLSVSKILILKIKRELAQEVSLVVEYLCEILWRYEHRVPDFSNEILDNSWWEDPDLF